VVVQVTGTTDVNPGHGMLSGVNGKTLAIYNVDGIFHPIDITCIHRGGPLGE
jgi:3-phenylpropionate/trans-cinnamate dioxygenase ferredoxin component